MNPAHIQSALVSRFLVAYPAALNVTQWENGPTFDPAGVPLWFEVYNISNAADPVTLGDGGQDETKGIFQIHINTSLGFDGTSSAAEVMAFLNSYFTAGTVLNYDSAVVRVSRSGKEGPSGESGGYYRCLYSVYWFCRHNR